MDLAHAVHENSFEMNSHVAKCAGTFIQMTAKMWTVRRLAQTFFLLLSLQGRPPTKKATVLNKVNKVLPSLTGTDGEGTEHTRHTGENERCTQTLHRILLQLSESSILCVLQDLLQVLSGERTWRRKHLWLRQFPASDM